MVRSVLSLAFCVFLVAYGVQEVVVRLSSQEDPTYDHQKTTYTASFKPLPAAYQNVSVMPFFSPDHSIDVLTAFVNDAQESIVIYTPGFISWSNCSGGGPGAELEADSSCQGCTIEDQKNEAFPLFPALLNAVHRGVSVRIITNDYEVPTCTGKIAPFDWFSLNGIKVGYYTSTTFVHAKAMMADGKVVSVSSVNWSKSSFMENREAGVLLANNTDIVEFFSSVFESDWGKIIAYKVNQTYSSSDMAIITSSAELPVPDPKPKPIAGAYVTPDPKWHSTMFAPTFFTSPDFSRDEIIVDSLYAANKSIALMLYQLTDPEFCGIVLERFKAGVNVTVLVSAYIDDQSDAYKAEDCYCRLYQGGLRVQKTPTYYSFSHQKFWIIDSELLGMSTGNWSPDDFPNGTVYPPFSNPSWQPTNRDFSILTKDYDTIDQFADVLNNDYARGYDYTPKDCSGFAA